jgi:hypothetical protein
MRKKHEQSRGRPSRHFDALGDNKIRSGVIPPDRPLPAHSLDKIARSQKPQSRRALLTSILLCDRS